MLSQRVSQSFLGNNCASVSFAVTEAGSEPSRITFDDLQPGHGVLVQVLRDGKPVPGAMISCVRSATRLLLAVRPNQDS